MRSGAHGTSGSSFNGSGPYCTIAFAILSGSQFGRVEVSAE